MNLKLFLSQYYIPRSFREAGIKELHKITARAFDETGINVDGSEPSDLVANYAQYTKLAAEGAMRNKQTADKIRARLFYGAYGLGNRLRKELGLKGERDFRIAARSIYKALQIDFSCSKAGQVLVRKCFFSSVYTADVCAFISSIDSGLIAGLSGGRKILFTDRITENKPCCRARIV